MELYLYEFIGTALLLLLGNGVVANVALNKTYGENSGLIVITFGWAIAVFAAVFISTSMGGDGHLNPAVTIGLAALGTFKGNVIGYVIAQLLGAMLGSLLVYLMYQPHYDATEDGGAVKSTFCTAPAISSLVPNFLSETFGTFVLVLGAMNILGATVGNEAASLGALDALPIALVVLGVGLSLGGPTGYAINPARDLGPRIMHAILPMKGKVSTDWGYSWLPIVGPITGALLAALVQSQIG